MNSVTNVCSIFVLLLSYFSIVILTLILFEWLYVHMNPALIILALLSPLIFFNNNANNSLLSLSHAIHGGLIYLWQNRQKLTIAYFVIPIVMSVLAMVHAGHTLPIVGRNWTPHIGHNMVTYLGFSIYILFFTFC